MKILLLLALCAIFFIKAHSQVPGTWLRDWQNTVNSLCTPDSFTVSNTSNSSFIIAYDFYTLNNCPTNSTNYTATLTVNNTTGEWIDSNNQTLQYDPVNDIVFFLFSSSNYTPYLYDKTGSIFPQQSSLGNIGGSWINPTPLGSASLNSCCVPDSLFIIPEYEVPSDGTIHVLPSFTTNNCSTVNTSQEANITVPSLHVLNWTSKGYGDSASANYVFDPNTSITQLTFTLYTGSNICGSYSYQKSSGVKLLNNTWHLDWQSNFYLGYAPSVYQVTPVNNSYMLTTGNYFPNITQNGYLVQDLDGLYYDGSLGLWVNYNESSQTLMSVETEGFKFNILFSLNGTYLSNPLTDSNWSNAQSLDSNPLSKNCCIPSQVSIYTYGNLGNFGIDYYLPDGYRNISGCTDFTHTIENNTISGDLNIKTPSLSNLTWTDGYGSQIFFADLSNTSEITVGSFLGGCSFKLDIVPQPHPSPLSSGWIAMEFGVLMIMGIVMLLVDI